MGAVQAADNIYYVGVLDKKLRVFDIIMETDYGTTYNSYIVKGQHKTVLVEAAKDKFCEEFFSNIEEVCPIADIDYIVCNHTEPDHTGCIAKLLQLAPKATVLGSGTAITFLGEIINDDFPHRVITDKDVIDIGGMSLHFLYVPMLHWPDTMFTWIPEAGALFTCDSFGCHYANEAIFLDKMQDALSAESFNYAFKYYFDNIMGPYRYPHMSNALDKIEGLEIKYIFTGHGPVLRTDIEKYIEMYRNWSKAPDKSVKNVVISYVSAYGYTRTLAKSIIEGLRKGGVQDITTFDLVTDSIDDAKAAIYDASAVLFGSCTMVGDALPPIYESMLCLSPVIHRGKLGGAFGSYGWSGEACRNILARLTQLNMNLPLPALRVRLKPAEEDLEAAVQFGKEFAAALLEA